MKKTICMTLAIIMTLGVAMAARFSDVNDSHWAYEDVELLAAVGVIDGYPDGTFRPGNEVTRYEYAKLLCEAMGIEQKSPDTKVFEDVNKSHWAYGYANAVEPFMTYYRGGATKEYRGDVAAEREDIAASLVRALGWENEPIAEDTYTKFSDYADITSDLRKYVLIAYEKGLVNGYPDGTFGPSRSVTRAETAALLIRAAGDKLKKPETPVPSGPPNPVLEEMLEESRAQIELLQDETVSIKVTVEGDTLVVTGTLLLDIVDADLVKSLLEEGLNENQAVFTELVSALVSKGVSNAHVKVIYADKNGSEIYSKIF